MNTRKKIRSWAAIYVSLLALYTGFVLLDAFVIKRSYAIVEEPVAQAPTATALLAAETTPAPAVTPVISDTAYVDEDISINITTYRTEDATVHVADVLLADSAHLLTAFAENTYGRNITAQTSAIAEAHDAILAINGDYYGAQRSGYVIRGGVLYRNTYSSADQEILCIWPDGTLTTARAGDITAEALIAAGVSDVLSFGPTLVSGGEIAVTEDQEVGKARTNNPRTAIAMIEPLHYLFVVADGRTDDSAGLSLHELAAFLQGLGAQVAYNLDGGGSSTMVFMGSVVNYPTTRGAQYSERAVSDIVYVK